MEQRKQVGNARRQAAQSVALRRANGRLSPTVRVRLECLATNFALEVADARLLFDGDGNRILMVAEKALEGGGKLLLLWNRSAHSIETMRL